MKPFLMAASMALLSLSASADENATQVVRGFIGAYNQHSVEKMLNYVTDDVRWMHISGTQIEVETDGKSQFGAAMTDYFETLSSAQASILQVIHSSHYVSTVERVTWENEGEQLSQCSIGNFRVQDGKIAEFWYLPAHACDEQVETAAPAPQAASNLEPKADLPPEPKAGSTSAAPVKPKAEPESEPEPEPEQPPVQQQ